MTIDPKHPGAVEIRMYLCNNGFDIKVLDKDDREMKAYVACAIDELEAIIEEYWGDKP